MKYIKSVGIKNFFSYGPKETVLDLTGTGLTNISGLNGKGKTTIIEAMIFALYGKTRQETVKDVVNREIGKDCKVSVEFVGDDDEIYKVIRYRAHTTHGDKVYLFKNDKDISNKNVSDTNDSIVDIFGMPYVAFVNSTVFSSEFYSNFFSAKNSDRLTIFENILSLKEISYFYVEIKKIIKEIEEKEMEIKMKLTEAEAKKSSTQENLDNYSAQAKAKLMQLKTEKEEAQKIIDEAKESLKELDSINVDVEKAKLSNITLKEEYEKQISSKKEELKELLNNVKTISDEEKAFVEEYSNFDFDENKRKEEKYKEDLETIRIRETGFEKAKLQLDSSNSKISDLKSHIKIYEDELNNNQKDLEKIEEAICPFCGQKMNAEETEKKRKEIEEKIKSSNEKFEDYNEQITEEERNQKEYRETYNTLLGEINTLKGNLNKDFTPNTDLLKEKFLNAVKLLEEVKKEQEKIKEKKNTLEEEITSLTEKSSNIEVSKYTEEYLSSIQEKIVELNKVITDNNLKITAINGTVKSTYDKEYVETIKKQIEKEDEKITKIKEKLAEIEDDKKHYEYLGECCSNKSSGFKKFFIGEMIPVFNEKINQYLPFFFNDNKMEVSFDKDLNDTIKKDGKEITFSSLSRGQKTRMEIAAAFALFGLSRVFFSNQSGLLIVDELIDTALDEFGIKSAISILESFAEDSKVYIISHNPTVKENINDVIEVKTDENGFSYIIDK